MTNPPQDSLANAIPIRQQSIMDLELFLFGESWNRTKQYSPLLPQPQVFGEVVCEFTLNHKTLEMQVVNEHGNADDNDWHPTPDGIFEVQSSGGPQ